MTDGARGNGPDLTLATTRPKYVGKAVQRKEDPRLLTGAGRYTADIKLDRMVHLTFVRSDQAHARIVGIDVAEAEALPGVLAIFTAADFAHIGPVRAPSRMKDYKATSMTILARDKVRYVGEAVAVIVATDRYVGEDALALIDVDYDPLPPVADPLAACQPGHALVHEDLGTNVLFERTFRNGDVAAVAPDAAFEVSDTFRFHRKTPLAMEPRSYVGEYDRGQQMLTLHAATQIPGVIRDVLADLLRLPGHQIRVVAPDVGGGFGGKGSLYVEEVVVAALAQKLRRPVKWVSDRLEDMTSSSQAFDEIIEARLGVGPDGKFLYLTGDITGDVGAYSIYPWTAALEPVQVAGFLPGPYRIDHYQSVVRGVSTAKPPTGPYRGVGRPPAVFVIESLIDRAARRLGLDPKELRARNLVASDEFPYRIGSGIVWDRAGFHECLDEACRAIDYADLRARQQAARNAGQLMGIGIASYAELTGIGSKMSVAPGMPINTGSETASIRIDATGAVTATFAIASHGQSLETTLAQIVAEEVGVRPEDVRIVEGDTAAATHGTGTYASRSAVIGGGAAITTARVLLDKVKQAAAHLLDADPSQIQTGDGLIFVEGTNRVIDFSELGRAVYSDMSTLPVAARQALEASESYDPIFGETTAATHIAVVTVDPDTCAVRVERYVVAEDCGRMINPLVVDGQVHGGVAQGIGAALLEEMKFDPQGQVITASLADYLAPTAVEVPPIEVSHIETVMPANPGGFRGMGEGGTIGAPAAVANAIADALGHLDIDITELPVTGERLFRLIQAAENKKLEH